MSKRPAGTAEEIRLDWKTILGLSDPRIAGWQRVRAAQVEELIRLFPVICLSNIFNAVALVSILWGSVPRWELLVWLASILALMGSAARYIERSRAGSVTLGDGSRRPRTIVEVVVAALLWTIPPAFFADTASLEQQIAICLVSAGMMASVALTSATIPQLMLIFLVVTGTGLSGMTASAQAPLVAALPAIYAVGLGAGGLSLGHGFLRRKVAEIQLAERDEVVSLLLREFEQGGADWLWQIDTAKRLHHVGTGLARAAGREIAALEGTPLLRVLAGDNWEKGAFGLELHALLAKLNARENFSDLHLPVQINEETRWWRLSASPRYDDRGVFIGFRGVGSDVTEQRRSADAIDRAARYDALTGLANRAQLTDALRKAVNRAHRERAQCGLLLIDLDKFKPVNDTLGHPVGDQLLKHVADRLRRLLGEKELAGRLGGDEFAIVLRDLTDASRIDALGDAVIAALSHPFEVDGNIIRIGASVGAAIGTRDGRTVETLMRNADLALYRAKADGRGVHRRYEPQMQERADKRRQIEAALREAIDKGQFRLVYQPIIELSHDRIEGFEALLRWTHPELGDIPPAEFLPIAEEAQLGCTIGEWVMRTACAEAANWPDPLRVAVNLSFEQLRDAQLPATIISSLSHAGLFPSRLELEISEEIFLRDNDAVMPIVEKLRPLGVRIALDDFGTGYSALGYVRQGCFSTIKIDNSFVKGAAANDPESIAIIRAVVAMAGSLGIATTAEGTETAAQDRRVRELGCTRVQGYHFSCPVEADAARALVGERLRRSA